MCIKYFKYLGLSPHEIVHIYTSNPYAFTLDYQFILSHKKKIFEDLGISKEEIGRIFIRFPILASKSLVSISRKINYIMKNFSPKLIHESYFPRILCYDFKKYIEPRGKDKLSVLNGRDHDVAKRSQGLE